jgi:hypothetical protein
MKFADSVLKKLWRNADGNASWLDIKPLPKAEAERRRILREHGGTFNAFPPDLDMLASTKALKLVQEAKVSLPHFATHELVKFMSRNSGTIKMWGTVLSRIKEMRVDIQTPAPFSFFLIGILCIGLSIMLDLFPGWFWLPRFPFPSRHLR